MRILILFLFPFALFADPYAFFIPPKGWNISAPTTASHVNIAFIENTQMHYPATINLATEKFNGTLKEYLSIIKKIHTTKPMTEWREAGAIQTRAGSAMLTEIDTKNAYGDIRLFQMIFLKDQIVYIVTTSALKKEYGKYIKTFEKAMSSFMITSDLLSVLSPEKKEAITHALSEKKEMKKIVEEECSELGIYWQALFLAQLTTQPL
jgi:hypothetical protein